MKERSYNLCALAIILACLNVSAKESPTIVPCVPESNMVLGNISTNDDLESITKKLGKPISIGEYSGEDDGGQYTGKVFTFENIEIYYNQLRGIQKITTKNKNILLISDVHVGMSLEAVGEMMHFNPRGRLTLIEIPVCGSNYIETREVHLHFLEEHLTQIDILHYGP
jgi:hypothetical protein